MANIQNICQRKMSYCDKSAVWLSDDVKKEKKDDKFKCKYKQGGYFAQCAWR